MCVGVDLHNLNSLDRGRVLMPQGVLLCGVYVDLHQLAFSNLMLAR